MKSISIEIETQTPIFTGGVHGECDVLHESGIMGSIRWWYEAMVRGLGGHACDPSKHQCQYEDGNICGVCEVFGTTGQRRKFDLRIIHDNTEPAWKGEMLNVCPPDRSHGWYLSAGRVGSFTLKMRGETDIIASLSSLFLFLEKWGAIGAKPQLGYGFFKINNREQIQEYASDLSKKKYTQSVSSDLPDLRQFTFFKYRFRPSRNDWWTRVGGLQRLLGGSKTGPVLSRLAKMEIIPVSPVLKNQWRYVEWPAPPAAKQWIFGTINKEKIRSKVSVSWAYREKDMWVVRGWAWLPDKEHVKNRTIHNGQDIDQFEKILTNELVWKKALHLDNNTLTDLYVKRIKNNENDNLIKLLRGRT